MGLDEIYKLTKKHDFLIVSVESEKKIVADIKDFENFIQELTRIMLKDID